MLDYESSDPGLNPGLGYNDILMVELVDTLA